MKSGNVGRSSVGVYRCLKYIQLEFELSSMKRREIFWRLFSYFHEIYLFKFTEQLHKLN